MSEAITKEDLLKMVPELDMTEEQKKYIRVWEVDDYRKVAPGEMMVDDFLTQAEPKPGSTIVDWGCGTGRASRKLYEAGLDVTMVDFAINCLDEDVKELAKDNDRLRFIEHDLTKSKPFVSDYGFCTDVMEHIPTEDVDKVLDTILDNSRDVFFQISTAVDRMGDHPDIDERLHLTVKPYMWWLEKLVSKSVIVHASADLNGSVVFYVSGWGKWNSNYLDSKLNVSEEVVLKNMEANSELGFMQLKPFEAQPDKEVMIIGGGPTLNQFEDEIRQKRRDGAALVTCNGSYNWALTRGMEPSLQMMIDAREFNERFVCQVDGLTDRTKFIIGSQCHPKVFRHLPKDRTWMMQMSLNDEMLQHIKRLYGKMYEDWFPVIGGSTVVTRGLAALLMMGFRKFTLYGVDSCLFPGKDHHAYSQPENDNNDEIRIRVGEGTEHEREFLCNPWHIYQAEDFMAMLDRILKGAEIDVKGDGLIAYLMKTNAQIA